jgi:tetratricopeptide (TPR) repeat protein
VQRRPTEDFIWVPGRWHDPALLEWQRGGNFELRIYPIPAQGSRRVVLAYTQIVHPHGDERRYVYPLPVSRDGSTRIGELNVDVRVAGADTVRSAGYEVTTARENDATTLTYNAHDFVPNGDLVIDYALPNASAELTSWTYQGAAATAPPENSRDQDREVIEAQRQVAADGRGYVTFALRPRLPASAESRPSDYVIVVDSSQSMVGERFTRASRLVTGVLAEMDRRDRFTVLACDYECRSLDGGGNATRALRTPSSDEVRAVSEWLGHVEPAGASDLGASLRAAAHLPGRDAARDVHVIYIGDGVASVGHRTAGALAEEAEEIASREHVSITTVGIGGDADTVALGAIARAGGGHYVPYVPGERASTAALAVLETTYGVSLEDASYTLPAGLTDAAPSALPTVRAGEEVMIVARMTQPNVTGDVVLRGTVGGQPFEHHYPVALTPSTSAGNLFVPSQWAAGTIEELELQGRGSDEARIVALSKAYSVMSRHTSLLVLESDAMFRAFGIDRNAQQAAAWTGEEAAEGSVVAALDSESENAADEAGGAGEGLLMGSLGHGAGGGGVGQGFGRSSAAAGDSDMRRELRALGYAGDAAASSERARESNGPATTATRAPARMAAAAPAAEPAVAAQRAAPTPRPDTSGRWMRRTFVRVGDVSASDEITFREQEAARVAEQALQMAPDSRDRHRAAVRTLSRAGNVSRALEVAEAWISRDRLDPEALIARADLLARSGHGDEALRVLTGVVDLRPDDALLQERLVNAFQRAGREDRSCAHRVALAEIDTSNVDRVGAALRCERALGRSSMANVLLESVREASARERAERIASTVADAPRTRGDLMVEANWPGGDDIDISLIAPDGSRISWMGGRTNVVAMGPTSAGSESLGLRTASVGSYQIEITRTGTGTQTVSGELRIRALDSNQTIPFSIGSGRRIVGRATVRREERFEQVGGW